MPINNLESSVDRSPANRAWYDIVRRLEAIPEIQTQDYVQQVIQREANGVAPVLPTPEELELLMADLDNHDRWTIETSLMIFREIRTSNEFEETVTANDDRDFHGNQENVDEGSGIQFTPSQVEEFLQTLSRVEIGTLGTDDVKCSICKQEYGKTRGDSIRLASGSDQGLEGEEAPEDAVKLPCGHVFGEWCMKTWFLGQPASCPGCRFQFEPVQ